MNRTRFSLIAHRDHTFANPLSEEKIDRLLRLLDLPPDAQVLDVGCGNAELLIRLIERYRITGTGVEHNAEALADGPRRAQGRIPVERLQLHAIPAADFKPDRLFDAALCIGASHAYGGYTQTLAALKALVRPGGQILIGEGYWKRDPDPKYLAVLGAERGELTSHAKNVSRAVAAGLTPLYSVTSSDDDWDHYEGLYCRAIERFVAAHPDDPDSPEFAAYIRRWYAAYLRWGRETLGFGLYLFQNPRDGSETPPRGFTELLD
ncbi:MAG TPA: class I SAM-dependent methyltransferase [Herpetosiphonaceae bacterium]